MKKFYIAGIVPEIAKNGGGYSVYIPDVPQVAAGGENVAEAISNATAALYLALRGMTEQNAVIPEPSPLGDVQAKVRAERKQDGLPYPKETVYQFIPAPSLETVPLRLNISLPKSLVEEMDEAAHRLGMPRSGFIAVAAREYMDRLIT